MESSHIWRAMNSSPVLWDAHNEMIFVFQTRVYFKQWWWLGEIVHAISPASLKTSLVDNLAFFSEIAVASGMKRLGRRGGLVALSPLI